MERPTCDSRDFSKLFKYSGDPSSFAGSVDAWPGQARRAKNFSGIGLVAKRWNVGGDDDNDEKLFTVPQRF